MTICTHHFTLSQLYFKPFEIISINKCTNMILFVPKVVKLHDIVRVLYSAIRARYGLLLSYVHAHLLFC